MSDHSSLPARPSLEQLRKQAKELIRSYRANDGTALARLRAHKSIISEPTGHHPATLADAQLCLAREHGFESWPKLKRHIILIQRPADFHEPTWLVVDASYTQHPQKSRNGCPIRFSLSSGRMTLKVEGNKYPNCRCELHNSCEVGPHAPRRQAEAYRTFVEHFGR